MDIKRIATTSCESNFKSIHNIIYNIDTQFD